MGEATDALEQLEHDIGEAISVAKEAIYDEAIEMALEETKRCLSWARSGAPIAKIIEAIEAGLLPTKANGFPEISEAERGGDSRITAEAAIRVRESARDTDATGDGDGLGPVAVPGTVGAQAGDPAPGSASPSNVLGKLGAGAEPGASRPAAAPADQPAAPAPDELCDIDDLPDCLVAGVHQPHCRHAGKPVTKGSNP